MTRVPGSPWYVYELICPGANNYIGYSGDLPARLSRHRSGINASDHPYDEFFILEQCSNKLTAQFAELVWITIKQPTLNNIWVE